MFTYKFVGLDASDAPTPYYYGSLPVKPERGHILKYDETGNRYAVIGIEGEGLEGAGPTNQKELAWADINRGEKVPTLFLQKLRTRKSRHRRRLRHRRKLRRRKELGTKEIKPTGQSFDPDKMKEYSQKNRKIRLSASAKKAKKAGRG